MLDRVYMARAAAAARKKANLANSRQAQHKPSSAKLRMSMRAFFCM